MPNGACKYKNRTLSARSHFKFILKISNFPAEPSTRRQETVADITVGYHPSEVEQALRHLLQLFSRHIRQLGSSGAGTSAGTSGFGGPSARQTSGQLQAVVEAGKKHLERMEAQRKLFLQVRFGTVRVRVEL